MQDKSPMPSHASRRDRSDVAAASSASQPPSKRHTHSSASTSNPKRHSLDSHSSPYAASAHSKAIPRGNGHQAMSIPMPPPPSLYFSLLPTSHGGGAPNGSHSASNSPRPSPVLHSVNTSGSTNNNSNSNGSSNNTNASGSSGGFFSRRSKSTSSKTRHPQRSAHFPQAHSDPSTPTAHHPSSLYLTPITPMNLPKPHRSPSPPGSAPSSRAASNPSTPGVAGAAIAAAAVGGAASGSGGAAGYSHYNTHHHPPRGNYPLSVTHSRRSSMSHATPGNGYGEVPDQRHKLGFFDMAIFDPAPDRAKSARSSIDHDGHSHRIPVSRPPSIESMNSSNSVPFAPPPPPPPSAWKRFTNHFSKRVMKRHVKFVVALYLSSAMALIPQIARILGPAPYLTNVAVVFMHPARTVGSQLEVTLFSAIGGVLAAIWIIPCQLAVVAFNQKYLAEGNNAAWTINAAWFFVGVWVMTLYKTRYAKLNCSFIIYTIAGIFALTKGQKSTVFSFNDFWNLMGPMMLGIAICLIVSILFWPETASEGLGRALNESLDTSRALLNLSTRSFLLNHKTIALPKSAIEKAQSEVRMAQKKLYSAYREARYEVTYAMTNPADYKEVRVIVSALMRHLGSMSLVVQNERLLMLGHPDRDDEDLLTQSGGELSAGGGSGSDSASGSDSDSAGDSDSDSDDPARTNRDRADKGHQSRDYFGSATAEDATATSSRSRPGHRHRHHHRKSGPVESPGSEDGPDTFHRREQRRGSAAELRRIRQLLQRAENSTQAAVKARQQNQDRQKQQALQQTFQFDRGGVATAPPTPGGRGVFSVFGHHHAHRAKGSSSIRVDAASGLTTETLQPSSSAAPSIVTTPDSSRPNSIHEEQNLDTVKSFKSFFSNKSASRFKPKGSRPTSLKAGFKMGNSKKTLVSHSEDLLSGISLGDIHCVTMPASADRGSDDSSTGIAERQYHTMHAGLRFGTPLTDQQVRKAAEAYRKRQEKQAQRERKQAERDAKAVREQQEKQRQAEAQARAIPPKEVAFGDRKLFMSFLDIVRDPLQRLSDSCSRVMVGMERELVSGLSVEQDRLERIKRRNAQRADAVRAAEARKAEEEKTAAAAAVAADANNTAADTSPSGASAIAGDTAKESRPSKVSVLDRLRVLAGLKPRDLTKEDIDYAEALKSGLEKGHGKKIKVSKKGHAADTVHPNKFLQQDAIRNATSSGVGDDDDDDFFLPPDMSYVQYLTQELEVFDQAEAQGLRDFISTHPTLDVGPREEIFLIFFFLFALREIARELLRLGKYVEELEEQERIKMEEEGRSKRKKQLWWPKVVGNFWHWFAWGNYTQVKTSEGYNSLIRNATKNLEHRQPRTIQEEKALVEAKAAKAAAEKIASEAATHALSEKRAEQRKRRHSEMWDLPPLRRSATLSALMHRKQEPDLELGLGVNPAMDKPHRHPRGVLKHPHSPRSRSNSPTHYDADWPNNGAIPRRHRSHEPVYDSNGNRSVQTTQPSSYGKNLGDPSSLGGQEVLHAGFGDEEDGPSSLQRELHAGASKRAQQYSVAEIPGFTSLQRKEGSDLTQFKDTVETELWPKVKTVKHHSTAPPDLDGTNTKDLKSRRSQLSTRPESSRNVVLTAPSSTHQDRYPSFASSTSPALLAKQPESDSTAIDSSKPGSRPRDSIDASEDIDDSEVSTGSDRSNWKRRRDQSKRKSKHRNIFASFSRRPSEDVAGSIQHPPLQPVAPEPFMPPRSTFVNVRKPKTWRYRFWEFLQPFKSEEFKFGFKMAAALTFIGLWSWLQWSSNVLAFDRGQWAMLTVMAVLSPTVGATFSVCAMRIAGTLAGTLWAMLTYLALPRNPYVICAMMLVIAFAGVFLILESAHPKLGIIMLLSYSSITFIMYDGFTTETIFEVCYKRAVTVIIGIIIAVIMNSLLWPILARRELRKEIAFLIGRQGVLFAELVNKFLLEEPQQTDQFRGRQALDGPDWSNTKPGDSVHASDGRDEDETATKDMSYLDNFQDSFVERAEREAHSEKRKSAGQRGIASENNALDRPSEESRRLGHKSMQYQHEESRGTMDPDRLAFQHVEHQLQTKLIKISQLLELSGSEPRLKEEFPMKLYQQIIQCCQNILDRMVSMRMAAQLLSPEVRELVTGPMNYYRRDMVGALLLYFSVLSSSLASKSPLPPYLPSARMARLRVIYNVREAIAAHQAVTGEDHYTYIYYYAFSSALEEVIEELELLAILIKPIVGVTLVSSGSGFPCGGVSGDQLSLGSAMATTQLGIAPMSNFAPSVQPGTANLKSLQSSGSHSSESSDEEGEVVRGKRPVDRAGVSRSSVSPGKKSVKQSGGLKVKTGGLRIDVSPATATSPGGGAQVAISTNPNAILISPAGAGTATSPVMMMDESLLEGRHGQRYKDAIQVAQEASGQQVIEVSSPIAGAVPAQAQFPLGTGSNASASGRKPSLGLISSPKLPKFAIGSLSKSSEHRPHKSHDSALDSQPAVPYTVAITMKPQMQPKKPLQSRHRNVANNQQQQQQQQATPAVPRMLRRMTKQSFMDVDLQYLMKLDPTTPDPFENSSPVFDDPPSLFRPLPTHLIQGGAPGSGQWMSTETLRLQKEQEDLRAQYLQFLHQLHHTNPHGFLVHMNTFATEFPQEFTQLQAYIRFQEQLTNKQREEAQRQEQMRQYQVHLEQQLQQEQEMQRLKEFQEMQSSQVRAREMQTLLQEWLLKRHQKRSSGFRMNSKDSDGIDLADVFTIALQKDPKLVERMMMNGGGGLDVLLTPVQQQEFQEFLDQKKLHELMAQEKKRHEFEAAGFSSFAFDSASSVGGSSWLNPGFLGNTSSTNPFSLAGLGGSSSSALTAYPSQFREPMTDAQFLSYNKRTSKGRSKH
ncbi:hypothetical protein KVV02_002547 [Mortierella alpina]|uniref:ER transporter 6TM N-terminal domain-containing protein n=1 Tax=Mortierella alpina TaxID=64518 RepID=A0A9P8A6X5_MORAP|nr:hypothetical protein KVV02_002547 [Mortierella alpina]